MLIAAVIALCVVNLGILAGGVYAYRRFNQIRVGFVDALESVFYPENQGELSQFQSAIDQITEVAAQKIGINVQQAIRGSLGGTMKAVNAELEQEAIAADPSLAAVKLLPKSMTKNPILAMAMQGIFQKVLAGVGTSPPGTTGNNGKSKSSYQNTFDF